MNPTRPTTPPPLAPGGPDAPSLPPRVFVAPTPSPPPPPFSRGQEGLPTAPTPMLFPLASDCHNWLHEEPSPFGPMSLIGLMVEGIQHQERTAAAPAAAAAAAAAASQELDGASQLHYYHHHGGPSSRAEGSSGWRSGGMGEDEVRSFANTPRGSRRSVPRPERNGHSHALPESVRPRAIALRGVLADTLEILGGDDASTGLGRQANQ